VKSQGQAESIQGIADVEDKIRFIRRGMFKLVIGEVIFTVLVMEFKLRRF